LQGGGGTDQPLGFGRILHASQLDHDAAVALLLDKTGLISSPGATLAGAGLSWASASGVASSFPAGTWLCCGYSASSPVSSETTVWRRIA
jgi:hypothetical protein